MAQQQQNIIQFSGIVTAQDSLEGLTGVVVYVPNSQRGTVTNEQGFFSMPVLPGDSVVVAALGFGKRHLLIPEKLSAYSYSTHIILEEKKNELPTVDVMPWATERDLREAIARVKLPEQAKEESDIEQLIRRFGTPTYPMDGTKNAGYGIQQQMRQQQGRYMVPSDVKFLSIPIRRGKR